MGKEARIRMVRKIVCVSKDVTELKGAVKEIRGDVKDLQSAIGAK